MIIDASLKPIGKLSNLQPFECDEPDDESEMNYDLVSRIFDKFAPDDDDYESEANACESRNRTIYPKALNNIHNELKPVVNNSNFTQSIDTMECV